jgi:hypothetical protein
MLNCDELRDGPPALRTDPRFLSALDAVAGAAARDSEDVCSSTAGAPEKCCSVPFQLVLDDGATLDSYECDVELRVTVERSPNNVLLQKLSDLVIRRTNFGRARALRESQLKLRLLICIFRMDFLYINDKKSI